MSHRLDHALKETSSENLKTRYKHITYLKNYWQLQLIPIFFFLLNIFFLSSTRLIAHKFLICLIIEKELKKKGRKKKKQRRLMEFFNFISCNISCLGMFWLRLSF